MATTIRTTIANDDDKYDNDDSNVTMMTMISFFQATINLWSDAFLAEGGVGDFYDDDDNEDDRYGEKDEDDHCHYLFSKVLPMQSTEMAPVRTTTMTYFYDATTYLMDRCIPGRGGGWVISTMMMTMRMTTMATTMRTTIAVSSFRRCYQCSQRQ